MSRKKAPKAINIVDRRRKALELRRAGDTYESIAQAISKELKLKNYSRSRAFEDVRFALEELNREFSLEAQELRRLETEKIDRLESALWPLALVGNVKAADALKGLMDRRARLLGLDAPIQLLVDQAVNQELAQAVDRLQGLMSPSAYGEFLRGLQILGESKC
jgi:hypothetical protein